MTWWGHSHFLRESDEWSGEKGVGFRPFEKLLAAITQPNVRRRHINTKISDVTDRILRLSHIFIQTNSFHLSFEMFVYLFIAGDGDGQSAHCLLTM